MTYTIPAGTPKAVKAAAFGHELSKALAARDIPMKEAAKAAGVGRTSIGHYRTGAVLPKTRTARALADILDWPKLGEMAEAARTFACERPGCTRTYRHEGGGPRLYCRPECQRQAEAQRVASRRLRQAGQTGDPRSRSAAIAQLRSAARIADERAQVAETAIAAMCRSCEPQGLCRTPSCDLRILSPLPLNAGRRSEARTLAVIRAEALQSPAVRAKRSVAMRAVWADPEYHERTSAASAAAVRRRTPEQKAAIVAKAKAAYPAERRSAVSKAMHAARRAS